VYGAMQDTQWVLPAFVDKAISNKLISVHSDGSQVRAFCYVSDVADAFQSVLETANGEIINVGNDNNPISIKELAEKIISLTNSQSEIEFVPFEESNRNRTEIMKRIPDISKAKKILNYSPKITLDEGIEKVAKHRQKINSDK
jgi:nucleoside-diphosphate-sugar epimerase